VRRCSRAIPLSMSPTLRRTPRVASPPRARSFRAFAAFKASGEFTGIKSEKTKTDYLRYLKMIENEFGTMPVAAVEDKRARGKFKEWRDTMADRPRTADYAWAVLARVLSVAKDSGVIAVNVCERGGRLYETDRTEIIWTANHITKFCTVASDALQFALLLALWTGQRQGDLIRLTWAQYDGSKLRLAQRKGRKRVVIRWGRRSKPHSIPAVPRSPPGQSCETPSASHGPATASGQRSSAPGSARTICTSTTCAGPRSRGWLYRDARRRRLLPLSATHRATSRRSLKRTTLAVGSNWRSKR
jgi:hypothetical protein